MKIIHALLAAAILTSPAAAQSLEVLRFSADAALQRALIEAEHPDLSEPMEPILQPPLNPIFGLPPVAPGAVAARASLADILGNGRRILTRAFGARTLDLGMASDAAFSSYYLTFTDAATKTTSLAPLGDLERLRGAGVDARIDANTSYLFKVTVNLFSPVRGSTLKMSPSRGTRGPQHSVKTGALLDAIRARSLVFRVRGQELWMLYGADAKPDASGFADTRSMLFIKEDGLSSKAWPLAESKLPIDTSAIVDLGGLQLNLTRTAAGELIIRE